MNSHLTITALLTSLLTSLLFYANYDSTFNATYSKGNGKATIEVDRYKPHITTGSSGRFGEAAEFVYEDLELETVWTKDVLRYQAKGNFPYAQGQAFVGTIGMWLQIDMEVLKERSLIWLDPVHLLGPGSRDGGKIWMDFVTKELTDTSIFRFGATLPSEDRKNPDNPGKGHIIIVPHIGFTEDEWHHIVGTWKNLNSLESTGVLHLYFDGIRMGSIEGFKHRPDWNSDEWEIRVVLGSKGNIDKCFILDKFISEEEINALYKSKVPLNKLLGIQ